MSFLFILLTNLGISLLRSLIVCLAYNSVLQPSFNLPHIGYWQWFAICLIIKMIFGRIENNDE